MGLMEEITSTGSKNIKGLSARLKRHGIKPDTILFSNWKIAAMQTADIITDELELAVVPEEDTSLSPRSEQAGFAKTSLPRLSIDRRTVLCVADPTVIKHNCDVLCAEPSVLNNVGAIDLKFDAKKWPEVEKSYVNTFFL